MLKHNLSFKTCISHEWFEMSSLRVKWKFQEKQNQTTEQTSLKKNKKETK